MNQLLTMFIVALVGVLLVGGVLFAIYRDSLRAWQLLQRLRKLQSQLSDADATRRDCQEIYQQLSKLAERRGGGGAGLFAFPDDTVGLEALLLAEVMLAALNYRGGKRKEAAGRIARLRQRLQGLPEYASWLVHYYVLSGEAHAEAVKLFVDACISGTGELHHHSRADIEQSLCRICSVADGMSKDQLRERIQWNQLVQRGAADAAWPWIYEAAAWTQLESWNRAKIALEKGQERFPNDVDLQFLFAQVLHSAGDRKQASEKLLALAEQHRDQPRVMLAVADNMSRNGQFSEAENILAQVSTADATQLAAVQLARATILIRMGNKEQAMALLEQNLHDHRDPHCGMLLAQLYTQVDKHEAALTTLQSTISTKQTNPQQCWAMAAALWNSGMYAEAAEWFTRCQRAEYRTADAARYYSLCMSRLGRREEAADTLETAPANSTLAAAEAAFYRGVALYESGSPDRAFPQFVRAQQLAHGIENRNLSSRAGINGVACLQAMAQQRVQSGEYEQAAKALQRLRVYYKNKPDVQKKLAHSQAECHVRTALAELAERNTGSLAAAVTSMEAAIELRDDPPLHELLAALLARQGQYARAAEIYDRLLHHDSQRPHARFARSLCLSRVSQHDSLSTLQPLSEHEQGTVTAGAARSWAVADLQQTAGKPGPFAIRAALVIAAGAAQEQRYAEAAHILYSVLRLPDAMKDAFAGEARCQTVLFTLRSGDIERAKMLAGKLLGGGRVNSDAILGTLLAHHGNHQEALSYLESGIAVDGGQRTTGTVILDGVYARVAHALCHSGDYPGAASLLERAVSRSPEPGLTQFSQLVQMTIKAGASSGDVDDSTISLLDQTLKATSHPSPLLIRASAVAYQQLARRKSSNGGHHQARQYWDRSLVLIQQLKSNISFWQDYIESYNVGKQYPLTCTPAELQQRVFERMAAVNVLTVRDILLSFVTSSS